MERNRRPPSRWDRPEGGYVEIKIGRNRARRGSENDRSEVITIPIKEELLVVLASCRWLDALVSSPWSMRSMFECCRLTGLPVEEVCALTWSDLPRLEQLIASRSTPSQD